MLKHFANVTMTNFLTYPLIIRLLKRGFFEWNIGSIRFLGLVKSDCGRLSQGKNNLRSTYSQCAIKICQEEVVLVHKVLDEK